MARLLYNREGVMQVDPLSMIAYGIGALPPINNLKREVLDATHPWYADDAGALGMFASLETYFDLLTRQGPRRRYHPKPSNSVLIVRPDNLETGKLFEACHGSKVCTVARYLGSYSLDDESKHNWLRERTLMWEKNISTIKNAGKYPQ